MENANRPQPNPCPECHGERVWAKYHLRVVGATDVFNFVTAENVKERFMRGFPESTRAEISEQAIVCTVCGHLALFVAEPHKVITWRADAPYGERE